MRLALLLLNTSDYAMLYRAYLFTISSLGMYATIASFNIYVALTEHYIATRQYRYRYAKHVVGFLVSSFFYLFVSKIIVLLSISDITAASEWLR